MLITIVKGVYMRENQEKTHAEDKVSIVPIPQKLALTVPEAAEYSNIGLNKISELLRQPNCPFVLYVGKKKLVKREAFERFIRDSLVI